MPGSHASIVACQYETPSTPPGWPLNGLQTGVAGIELSQDPTSCLPWTSQTSPQGYLEIQRTALSTAIPLLTQPVFTGDYFRRHQPPNSEPDHFPCGGPFQRVQQLIARCQLHAEATCSAWHLVCSIPGSLSLISSAGTRRAAEYSSESMGIFRKRCTTITVILSSIHKSYSCRISIILSRTVLTCMY